MNKGTSKENKLTVLYDGDCPICRLNKDILESGETSACELQMTDVRAADFPDKQYGVSRDEMLQTLCAIDEQGRIYKGMDAVQQAYARRGLGWLIAPSRWPLVRPVADAAYVRLARHRFAISGVLKSLLRLPQH